MYCPCKEDTTETKSKVIKKLGPLVNQKTAGSIRECPVFAEMMKNRIGDYLLSRYVHLASTLERDLECSGLCQPYANYVFTSRVVPGHGEVVRQLPSGSCLEALEDRWNGVREELVTAITLQASFLAFGTLFKLCQMC